MVGLGEIKDVVAFEAESESIRVFRMLGAVVQSVIIGTHSLPINGISLLIKVQSLY